MTQDPRYAKRWRLDHHRGITRLVDAGPAREHVGALRAAGASVRGVAEVAHVAPSVVSRLTLHPGRKLQRAVAARLLAVTMGDVIARPSLAGFVPRVGARRRVEALLALGWRHADIDPHLAGVGTRSALVLHQRGAWVTRATHDAVVAAYDALSMRQGPSDRTRARAARAGYAPPLAWDDIDDPAARPNLYGYDTAVVEAWLAGYPPADVEAADRDHVIRVLHTWGHTDGEIARLTGLTVRVVHYRRHELGLAPWCEPGGRPTTPVEDKESAA